MSTYGTINGIDTTQAAWQAALPTVINLNGWNRQAAFNYLCQLAGVAPNTQTVYADRPTGRFNTTDSTEDLLVATANNPLVYNGGYKLQTVFYAVSVVRGTLTLTTADPSVSPDTTPSTGGLVATTQVTQSIAY